MAEDLAWQGACVAGGVHGRGECGGGESVRAWQKRWTLQRSVRIILKCILVLKLFVPSNFCAQFSPVKGNSFEEFHCVNFFFYQTWRV